MTELLSCANQLKIPIDVPTKIFNFAIDNNNEGLIKLILDSGASAKGRLYNVNTIAKNDGWTALMYAAWNNKLDVVISLLNHPRIDLNVLDRYNDRTALHWAVIRNHPDIVSQLLQAKGINTYITDQNNKTPFDYTASDRKNYKTIIDLFAEHAPSLTRNFLSTVTKKRLPGSKEEIPEYIKFAIQPKPTIHPKYGDLRY